MSYCNKSSELGFYLRFFYQSPLDGQHSIVGGFPIVGIINFKSRFAWVSDGDSMIEDKSSGNGIEDVTVVRTVQRTS